MSSQLDTVQCPVRSALRSILHLRLSAGVLSLVGLVSVTAVLSIGYYTSLVPVTVRAGGPPREFRTHQRTVCALLDEAGLSLGAEDRVDPPCDAPLFPGLVIDIRRALPMELEVDGRLMDVRTHGRSAAAVLQEAGVSLDSQDEVIVNGQLVDDPARPFSLVPLVPVHYLNSLALSPEVHIRVRRAVPFELVDDGLPVTVRTTGATVGAALEAAQESLHPSDQINVPLDTPLTPGLRVVVQRSRPVTIVADGRTIATRTRARTVAEVLAQEGIQLFNADYTLPGVETAAAPGSIIQVIRVKQEYLIEEERIAYETVWQPNADLEIDHTQLGQTGVEGIKKRRIRKDYENGVEISSRLEAEWIDSPARPEIWHYGSKIVIREIETPEGTLSYWRKLRMHATAYSAATSGKSPDHPAYGITRLGWRATRGVAAIDPRIISLSTRLYVPGYGLATAADTGGYVRGMRIDLCFDEDKLESWYRWVDVYLLAPPPPANLIRYRLPDVSN